MKLRQIPFLLVLAAATAHAAAPNLIANPELEANLLGWTGSGGVLSRVALDVFGRADSGSAQLAAALGTDVILAQCVALPANAHVDFGAWVEIPGFQEPVTGSAVVKLQWWSELGCGGTQLDVEAETATISATGRWSYAALRNVAPPEGSKSAKLRAISQPNAEGFLVKFDSLFVAPAGELFVPVVGEIVVADGSQKIVKVEPETGAQRLITSGVYLARPTGVAIDPSGLLWVVTPVGGSPLVSVDPATGLQEPLVTTGDTLDSPRDVDIAGDGSLWIAGDGLWEVTLPDGNVALRKSLGMTTAYGMSIDSDPETGAAWLVSLARGDAGLADFDVGSGELTPVAGTPTAQGRYDYAVWMPAHGTSTRVFTEVEPIAPSACNAAASGVLAIDGEPPILGGRFRCPRGLGVGGPDDPGYVSDGSAFTGSQEGQLIAIDRAGTQTLVTRSGFLVDPWDVEVVPEPTGDAAMLAAAGALAALVSRAKSWRRRVPTESRGGRGRVRERRVQPRAATLLPTRSITARQSPSARSPSLRV